MKKEKSNLKVEKDHLPRKEILTAQETMEILGISRNTFYQLKNRGELKVYKLGRRLYCKYSEILESLDERLVA